MVEVLERVIGSGRVKVTLCFCESCRHAWLTELPPLRCSKCKTRLWNTRPGEDQEAPSLPPPRRRPPPPQRQKQSRAVVDTEPSAAEVFWSAAEIPPVPVPPVSALSTTQPGGTTSYGGTVCPRCGLPLLNNFAQKVHDCRP
jgi:hypothetical protein